MERYGNLQHLTRKNNWVEGIDIEITRQETETEKHFRKIYKERWNTSGGQPVEELQDQYRQRLIAEDEIVENEHLQQTVLGEQGNADAAGAAPGAPMLDQAAAKKTRKQQREDRRRDNKAKRISNNQNADHVSYNMVERLQNREKAADAYINGSRFQRDQEKKEEWAKQVKDADVNPELLKAFYKEGGTFIDDYTRAEALQKTGRVMVYEKEEREARTRALDGIVNDMIATQITPEMLTPAYLETHIDEMKALSDRMRYFKDNICTDQNNSFYFGNTEDIGVSTRVQLLNAKLELADVLRDQLDYVAGQKAVDVRTGDYIRQTQQQDALTADLLQNEGQTTVQRQDQENVLTQKLQELQQKEDSIYAGAVERELQEKLKTVRDDWHMEDSEESYIKTLQYEIAMEHEESYHKYQGAVDAIFLEECRAGDVSAEMSGTMMAYQLANREYQAKQAESNSVVDQRMAKLTLAKQMEYEKRYNDVEKNRQAYTDALDYYLKDGDAAVLNKDLKKEVKELLVNNAVENGHMKELMERVFKGKNGSIDQANAAYDSGAKNSNMELRAARSAAITMYALRTSGSIEDRIAVVCGQKALEGTGKEALDYYGQKSVVDVNRVAAENGVNVDEVTSEMKNKFREHLTVEAFDEMMDKFKERLTGEAGLEYMRSMLPYTKDVHIFEDDVNRIRNENAEREKGKEEAVNTNVAALIQNLMLKFTGAAFGTAAAETGGGHGDMFKMCKTVSSKLQKVTGWVGIVSVMEENMTEEDQRKLPMNTSLLKLSENDKHLLAKYRAMVNEVADKLGLDTTARNASDAAADVDNAAVNNNILDGANGSVAGA